MPPLPTAVPALVRDHRTGKWAAHRPLRRVGFAGFGAIVDALGGVQMCPAEPINDPLAGIDLPAGCQTLDGPQALGYVRSRATARQIWTACSTSGRS